MTIEHLPPYVYEPLPTGEGHHIRVLTLFPGSLHDPVEFELILTRLHPWNGKYEAISYAWGDANDRVPAICRAKDGTDRLLLLTRSLDVALRRFRHPENVRLLWADACCINQRDKHELSQQVSVMNWVYQSAKQVLVWLGPDDDGSAVKTARLVVDLYSTIKELGASQCLLEDNESNGRMPNLVGFPAVQVDRPYDAIRDIDNFYSLLRVELVEIIRTLENKHTESWNAPKFWKSFEEYLSRTWFSRRWVLQEIQLNPNVSMFCGETSLPSICVLTATVCQMQWWTTIDSTRDIPRISPRIQAADIMLRPINQRLFNVLDILTLFGGLITSDPRDKIYAFLGLHTFAEIHRPLYPGGISPLKVNYSDPPSKVFTDFAIATMQVYKDLRVLVYAAPFTVDTSDAPSTPDYVPSWAPNWGVEWYSGASMTHNLWSAANGSNLDATVDTERKELTLTGSVIGKIESTYRLIDDEDRIDKEKLAQLFADQMQNTGDAEVELNKLWEIACSLSGGVSWTRKRSMADPNGTMADFAAFIHNTLGKTYGMDPTGNGAEYKRTVHEELRNCVVVRMEDGGLGSALINVAAGDRVCVVRGLKVPLVLRLASDGYSRRVAPAYVHGWMLGEAERLWQTGELLQENFVLR